MSVLQAVGLYLRALWAQWKVLLTGGTIMALVAIWALAMNTGLPYNFGWLILGVTFIAASFMAWRREHDQARGGYMTRSPQDERRALIANWRSMVTDVHKAMRTVSSFSPEGKHPSATELLEAHAAFPSIRPYLSETCKEAIWRRTLLVPPDQSTMDGRLHSILNDIDRLEKEWGLR